MKRRSDYDKFPTVHIEGFSGCAWQGFDEVAAELTRAVEALRGTRKVVCVDCYPGVWENEVLALCVAALSPAHVVTTDTLTKDIVEIDRMIERNLTDDRVFGVMCFRQLEEFFDRDKLTAAAKCIEDMRGVVLILGVGASLVFAPDLYIYADLPRWEIQQRYRSGKLGNWLCDNYHEDTLRKYKRGFFVEWRVADRHKNRHFEEIDYFLDTTTTDCKLMTGEALREGLRQTAERPFRVVPFFDPGVWGGQWMKEVCGLDCDTPNYAWCFDCVPEENSLLLEADGVRLEIPAIDLVLRQPVRLLGDKVHARFGAEFPIRFDFLDTVGGQNLSLQVHPLTEYIQNTFGMHYTQDESYYILDAKEGACVYLGVKQGVRADQLIGALEAAQESARFDDAAYINKFPAQKHDHFLIPAGTIHCSGADTMVLEISATPFIFTFKLWDWDRPGLDGKPRPVHIGHGAENIRFDRDTAWIEKNCINRFETVRQGEGYREERTGLHEREFIETRRCLFTRSVRFDTDGGVQVLNLVEGDSIRVLSPEGNFAPFEVHYAETFIIPASVGAFTLEPVTEGASCVVIRAYVRT